MKRIYISLIIVILFSTANGQLSFTELDVGFPEVYLGDAVWSDFNNNGHLDLLIAGYTYGTGAQAVPITKIYRNNGDGTFTDMEAGLFDLAVSKAVAGDFNNNGYNDIAMFGYTGLGGESYFKLYMNNGDESFTEMASGIPDLYRGDVTVGDFNNNGLLDILIAGELQNGDAITRVYLNNGDFTFTDMEAGITGLSLSAVAAGDLNSNGWQDIVISGRIGSFNYAAFIYMNNGDGTFSQSDQTIIGLRYSSISLGDYNNTGYLDILMNGSDNDDDKYTVIYKNNGDNTFTDINAGITGTRQGYVNWGDFNNNGLLDFVVTGEIDYAWTTRLYLQTGTDTFTDSNLTFTGARRSSVIPGDYNNDGKLDFLLIGWAASQDYLAELYRNEIPDSNITALAATGLFTTITDTGVQLHWEQSTGGTTPAGGLTYNIMVGSMTDGYDIVAPMADYDTGFRRVQTLGKYTTNSALLENLEEDVYYWRVQAIDHCYAGSDFSNEHIFTVGDIPDPTDTPVLLLPPDEVDDLAANVNLEWVEVDNAVYYTVEVADDDEFDNVIVSHNLALTNYWLSDLAFDTTYYWRVNSSNGVFPSAWSEVRSFTTIENLPHIDDLQAEVFDIDNVQLNWLQPVRQRQDEVTGYRVYRNGDLLAEIDDPDILEYSDEGLSSGVYLYHVTALFGFDDYDGLYESLPSDAEEITIYLIPPQNLTAEAGAGYVTLYWEEPAEDLISSRVLMGYNVYRDGNQINPVIQTDLSYTDETVTNGVLYNYHTKAVYTGGLSEPSNSVPIAPSIPALYPPRNLSYNLEGNEVQLQWYSYHDGEWFSWDNGMNSGGIGTNNPVQFEVAARFEPEDLLPYDGELLKFVSFVPRQVQCVYSIRVWTDGHVIGDDYDPGNLLIDQTIITDDLVMEAWNVIELADPLLIDASQELWIGYHIDTETGFPAGRDAGPAVVNKGDLVNLDGWESLSTANPNLDYNWNIQGFVFDGGRENVSVMQPLPYEQITEKGVNYQLSDETAAVPVIFTDIFRLLSGYKVYRNGNEITEISDPQENYFTDQLPDVGVYHYYVTALYGEFESPQSNIQSVVYTSTDEDLAPSETVLRQNYPNPFNPLTSIDFYLAESGLVELAVFNIKGQYIVSLVSGEMSAGEKTIIWDGTNERGKEVPAGVYFYRLQTSDGLKSKRMLLLK